MAPNRVIHVDDDAPPPGNGTARLPYNNLLDALADARSTSAAVVISVAPGVYSITSSLIIDRPLDLRGSSVLIEGADGWPTGEVTSGTETRMVGAGSLGTLPLLAVGRPDGVVIHDVSISGFVFEGTPGATEVLLTRVQGFRVQDNAFRAPARLGLQTIASSGRVAGNYFTGVETGAILAAGYDASPSTVLFTGNRSIRNNLGGVLLNGVSIGLPELGDELEAVIRDNDLSDNTATPNFSFGARLFIIRRDLGAPGEAQSSGNIRALLQDNRLAGNELGLVIDAGFPYRRVGATCDLRVYSGTIDLTLVDNTLTGSLLAPALVSFTRNAAALNPTILGSWQYLHGATFTINDPERSLAGLWIDHPELDPFVGPCPDDAVKEPLNNVFRYNGLDLPYDRNF